MTALKLLFVSFLCLTFCHSIYAQERYISDKILVPVRKGTSNKYAILHKGLPSGTRVSFLEESSDGNWSKIRTQGGITGWVRNQYLSRRPTASVVLRTTEGKLQKLQQQHQQLQTSFDELNNQLKSTQGELNSQSSRASDALDELQALKTISSGAIETNQRLQELAKKHQMLQTELDILRAENQGLKQSERNTFFVYGAAAVLLGVLLTLVVPRLKMKRRYSEWA